MGMNPTRRPRLLVSLVIPMLNERDNVKRLAERLSDIQMIRPDVDFELVAVDDGSTDDTVEELQRALPPTLPATLARLSRNFGSHYALSAGFSLARGDCAIALGADLQEPLSFVPDLLEQWQAGWEVVWGVRRRRAHSGPGDWLSRAFSSLFHRFANIATYPAEGPSGVLIDRSVLDVLARMGETNRNIYGIIAWVGFRQTRVEYEQEPRLAGRSGWNLRALIDLAIDSFVQFSSAPLRAAELIGASVASAGFLYAVVLVLRSILGAAPPEGWTTVVVLMLLVGGVQLLVLGIVGEYLWRTAAEARKRPLYLIRDVQKFGPNLDT